MNCVFNHYVKEKFISGIMKEQMPKMKSLNFGKV